MIICANLTKKVPLDNIFSLVNSIGFKSIQFSFVHEGINDDNPLIDNSFLNKAREMKNKAACYNLRFPVVHGWLPSTQQTAKPVLELYLDIKEILDANYLIFHPKNLENLNQIINLVKTHKSNEFMLIENVAEPSFKMGFKEIDLIVQAGINICFDTCHALENNLDLDIFLTKYSKRIKVIHLSDFDGNGRHLRIGTDKINKEFVRKISPKVIIVFEHKAKTPDEYFNVYSASFNKLMEFTK